MISIDSAARPRRERRGVELPVTSSRNIDAMDEESVPSFHGYAPSEPAPVEGMEPPLTVAISRQTGSRGRDIAKRTAELLGWDLINQETFETLTLNANLNPLRDRLSTEAQDWVAAQLTKLEGTEPLQSRPNLVPLTRTILEFASEGQCVLLGRGAGCVLPASVKLHVRLIAPERDRIQYIAQVERMAYREAEESVRKRDQSRREFIEEQFGRNLDDYLQYDLVLNTSRFGVEACAEIIKQAVEQKERCRHQVWQQ